MARMLPGPQFRDYQGLWGVLQVLDRLQSMQPEENGTQVDQVLQRGDIQQNPFGRRMMPQTQQQPPVWENLLKLLVTLGRG